MKKLKFIIIPVCLIIIALIVIIQTDLFKQKNNTSSKEWKIKEVYVDSKVQDQMNVVPKWNERTITEQFYTVNYLDTTYDTSRNTKLPNDKIGEKLEETLVTAHDPYENEYHNINATIFKVIDFPEKCVIAVQFEGTTEYYAYTNAYYRPETLGDFMKDLNLKEIVSFGTVYYEHGYTDNKGQKQYEQVEFYDVEDEKIWKMLFNDLTLENIYSDTEHYSNEYLTEEISISVDIPLLGIENISLSLTDKGYMITNILETGKGFYIGEEKVQEFIDYVIENHEGYKIVYIDTNEEKEPEVDPAEEKIMMTENTVDGFVTKEVDTNTFTSSGNSIEANFVLPYNPVGEM